jgi:integrase
MNGLKFSIQEIEKIFLTENELQALLEKEFTTDRLTQVRDVFAFCCFTGLAFIDIKQLRREDLSIGTNGETIIRKQRQKSGVFYNVPLLPVALQLLEKYKEKNLPNNQILPVPSNTKMNAYLKEIADLCGINKNLTTHVARHTFATTVTLANNVSIETVSKMLGHKNIKMTQHYAKVLEKTVVREMNDLSGKLNYAL